MFGYLKDTSPLGEVASVLLVLRATLGQPVETYSTHTHTRTHVWRSTPPRQISPPDMEVWNP